MKLEYPNYSKDYHTLSKRLNFKDKVFGFDTETNNGNIFLLTSDKEKLFNDDFSKLDIDEILKFLTRRKYNKSFNFFFNMRYDIQSILKLLPQDKIKEFYKFGKTEYKDYTIKGIDSKFIFISKNNRSYRYYDISQFYYGSLDDCGEKYCKLSKNDDDIDVDKFDSIDYIRKNKDKIIKYCVQDSYICKKLGEYWISMSNDRGFIFAQPFSSAYISQLNYINNCDIPTLKHIPHKAIMYSLNSYGGGLFDIYKRGTFENAVSYDINSAYPYFMTKLLDIQKGSFNYVKELHKGDNIKGWYKADIELFTPFLPIKVDGIVNYPVGKFEDYYLTKQEVEFIRDNDIGDVYIKDGWEFYADELKYPLKDFTQFLYEKRNELKEKDDDLEIIFKKMMNSFYGKLIQSITKNIKDNDKGKFRVNINNREILYKKIKKYGKMFNPFWASQITANTRILCKKVALSKPKKVISINTDNVMFKDGYKPKNIQIGDELGEWDKENKGKLTIINNGIYEWIDDNKFKLRGGLPSDKYSSDKDKTLISLLKENLKGTKFEIKKYRPITLKEGINHLDKNIIDTNKFRVETTKRDINQNTKRNWNRNFEDIEDCLNNNIDSKPKIKHPYLNKQKIKSNNRSLVDYSNNSIMNKASKLNNIYNSIPYQHIVSILHKLQKNNIVYDEFDWDKIKGTDLTLDERITKTENMIKRASYSKAEIEKYQDKEYKRNKEQLKKHYLKG